MTSVAYTCYPSGRHAAKKSPSAQIKHLSQRCRHGRIVVAGGHNILHIGPPVLHHGVPGQGIERGGVCRLQHREQLVRIVIEENGVVRNAAVFEQKGQFGPDIVVPAPVFFGFAGMEVHFEGDARHRSTVHFRLCAGTGLKAEAKLRCFVPFFQAFVIPQESVSVTRASRVLVPNQGWRGESLPWPDIGLEVE